MSNLNSWEDDPAAQEENLAQQAQQMNLGNQPQAQSQPGFRPGAAAFSPGAAAFQPGQAFVPGGYGGAQQYQQGYYGGQQGYYSQYGGQGQGYAQYGQGGYGNVYGQGQYNQAYGTSIGLIRSLSQDVAGQLTDLDIRPIPGTRISRATSPATATSTSSQADSHHRQATERPRRCLFRSRTKAYRHQGGRRQGSEHRRRPSEAQS